MTKRKDIEMSYNSKSSISSFFFSSTTGASTLGIEVSTTSFTSSLIGSSTACSFWTAISLKLKLWVLDKWGFSISALKSSGNSFSPPKASFF